MLEVQRPVIWPWTLPSKDQVPLSFGSTVQHRPPPHRKKAGPSDRSQQSFGLLPHLGRYFFEVLGIGWGCFPSNPEKAGTVLHNPDPIQKEIAEAERPREGKNGRLTKKRLLFMESLRIKIWKSVNTMARKGHQTPLTIWSLCLCPQRHEWSSSNKVWYPLIPAIFFPALWETQLRDGRDLHLREHLWLSSRCRTCPGEGLWDAASKKEMKPK